MPRQTPLPSRLRFLQPFRKQVAKMDPEEINEDMDLALLNNLLLKRIEGVHLNDGKALLTTDHEELGKWLATPDLIDQGGMSFLWGYLSALPELVDSLLEESSKPKPGQKTVQMEFPPDAKIKKHPHGLREIKWLKMTLFIVASDEQGMAAQVKMFQESLPHPNAPDTVTPVKFGEVSGVKLLSDLSVVGYMQAGYALKVPGGHVEITLWKKAMTLDTEKFEKYFHTLKLV